MWQENYKNNNVDAWLQWNQYSEAPPVLTAVGLGSSLMFQNKNKIKVGLFCIALDQRFFEAGYFLAPQIHGS